MGMHAGYRGHGVESTIPQLLDPFFSDNIFRYAKGGLKACKVVKPRASSSVIFWTSRLCEETES